MSLNERGVALPMALIVLMVIASLTTAFSVLATTEPMIAANHKLHAQARALAEAGIERALWALSHPAEPAGIPDPMGAAAAEPYGGNTYMVVSANGGFTVKVTEGVKVNERKVEAIGWTPTNNPADQLPKGVKRIETTVMKVRYLDPPCALCVEGELEVTGNAKAEAKADKFCPGGPTLEVATMTKGMTYVSGNGKIYGPDDPIPNEPEDMEMLALDDRFDFKWTDDEIAYIKSLAQANGAYYQGSVTFNSSNKLKKGVVFVDTTTAQTFTSSTPDAEAAYVQVHGGATDLAPDNSWSGWLIVAGSIDISGNIKMNGLVYAQNDIAYRGTGTGRIEGAVISENRKDDVATTVDANAAGNADIIYDCKKVRDGGGTIPQNWSVKAGTYKELDGSTHN